MADPTDPTNPLRQTVGRALGRVPSGVFILTTVATEPPGRFPLAMMVSWVQQAAFAPPSVCLALGRDRPIRSVLEGSRRFTLSVLGQGDSDVLKRFARGFEPDVDPFAGVPTQATPGGLPVLSDALAWLDCRLTQSFDFDADHLLLVAEVVDGQLQKDGAPFTHVRGNGFHY
jgi:3-hydroxy-9,10-secoandrosta-1,3,5(10)-triene-9,17-dione monooxygenase reductase component